MPEEFCPVLWIGQVAVVTLPAEIDVTNADAIREELLSMVNQGAALLIADLSKTMFCDSAGVSALVRTLRRAKANEAVLRLVVNTPAVQRVLSITGVDRLLGIFPSVSAALAGPYEQAGRGHQGGGSGGQARPDSTTAASDTDGGGSS
ncbi:MAG: STAS domain-containing protein [Streptosporangiaceae bacterium]